MTNGSGSVGCAPSRRISERGVGTPWRTKRCLVRILSIASSLPATPSPVYGTPRFSRMRWTWPSSPKVPWMTLNARSVSAGSVKSVPSTSTSVTIAPRLRSALATPAPEARETLRSEPGPPMRTAIFLSWRSIMDAFGIADNLHLGLQLQSALAARLGFDLLDQREHVL